MPISKWSVLEDAIIDLLDDGNPKEEILDSARDYISNWEDEAEADRDEDPEA